jgi:hypothetical protein
MHRNRFANKGPRPTARDQADHRERVERMHDYQEQDQAELADYAVAVSLGDWETANRISRERYQRSRLIFAENGQAGGGTPSASAINTDPVASPALSMAGSGEGQTQHEPALEPGNVVDESAFSGQKAVTAATTVPTESATVRRFDALLKSTLALVRKLQPRELTREQMRSDDNA